MTTTLITARCCCCTESAPLLPRTDLAPDLMVCPRSGRLHRAEEQRFVLADEGATLVRRSDAVARAPMIQIDLSKEGYA